MTELRRGHPLGSLHGTGEGQRGGHGAAAQEEEAVEPPAWVREAGREGGTAWWASSTCWAARGQKVGWLLGRLGQKLKENSFPNTNWIFEYTKASEICRRRFRRNFDMGIFPKFF
jgi:hypothetical protein